MNLRPLIQPPPDWLDEPPRRRIHGVALATVAGLALYGFTVGYWRSPVMGVFVAVKLPLLIALTLGCNGFLNGLLGVLLGTGLGFRQSLLALLSSFALAGIILGSLAPVTFLVAWNAPSPDSAHAAGAHNAFLLIHTLLIGSTGVVANLHLHKQLTSKAPNRAAATTTLLAWLGGNAFLGAQFSWLLRPFFGTPTLKVQFLRDDPFDGNFYLTVWNALNRLTGGNGAAPLAALAIFLVILLSRAITQQNITNRLP